MKSRCGYGRIECLWRGNTLARAGGYYCLMEETMALFNKPRVVSVSRRTDIPAFYGKWFRQRVRQGWAVSYNPFSRRAVRVSLRPEDVGAFVFCSKNFAPLYWIS